jgi:hypothetical protein
MNNRPYFNFSASELKVAIEENKRDVIALKKLIKEISYRKRGKSSLSLHLEKAKNYISSAKPPTQQEQDKRAKYSSDAIEGSSPETSENIFSSDKLIENHQKNIGEKDSFVPAPSVIRGKLGSIRKASNSLTKLPQVWSPKLNATPAVKGLKDAITNSEQFICALGGLIWEIRNGVNYSKNIILTKGSREKSLSGEYGFLYSFLYTEDEDLFEGTRINFKTGTKKTKGSVVSILPGKLKKIIISLDEDLGNTISKCTITQEQAALLESLQKRLEIETGKAGEKAASPVGMNIDIADQLLQGGSRKLNTNDYSKADADITGLNNGQVIFLNKAISHSISFLWGPPGTGKTKTLAAIISYFFKKSERTLICSNTNQAVDQVLLKLCRELEGQGNIEDLKDGKILRIGRITLKELADNFSQYVTVDGVTERKGSEITKKIKELDAKKLAHEKILYRYKSIIEDFKTINDLKKELSSITEKAIGTKNQIEDTPGNLKRIDNKLEELNLERLNYKNKGFFGKVFARGIVTINRDIITRENERASTQGSLKALISELEESHQTQQNLSSEIKTAEKNIKGHDLEEAENIFNKEDKNISEINVDLTNFKEQIKNLEKVILSQATVIGSTLTKTFLSPSELGKFHNTVIDEASMGLLPAVYFAASQSEIRCIISGDFRQLPPIIQSKNKAILDIIGSDIFTSSGIQGLFERKEECAHAGVLKEQYRMDSKICDLISEIGYEGELFTSNDRKVSTLSAPKGFEDTVLIVDTSAVYPFTDRDPFGSTSNMFHALIARNIMRAISNTTNSGNIGYCAPFKAQMKLMKKMSLSEPFGESVTIGTVHTFQGDEKSTMIFDTVNSLGEKHFLNPNLAQEIASKSNLLTVAVSRAQNRLIFIANLRYLDTKIPAMGYLRKILFSAQTNGTVIDARNIIDLSPLKEELNKMEINFQELNIPESSLKSGLVNEEVFFPLLKKDLSKAKKYIAIYTGFYTANRVNDLLPTLIAKVASGVKIRAIVPPPDKNGSMDQDESSMVVEKLEFEGILVEFRARIHQKAVLIDDDIAWFGSLNPLSFSGATAESMLRIEQDNVTGTFAANMCINRALAKEDPAFMVEKELSDCSYCGGKTVFHRGKYGPYVKCCACEKNEKF